MSTARPLGLLATGLGLVLPGAAAGLLVMACSSTETKPEAKPETAQPAAVPSREALTPTIDKLIADGRFKGELWRMNLTERNGRPTHAKHLSVDGDLVIAEDQVHEIHALDRASGVHRWMLTLAGPTSQPVGGNLSSTTFISTDELVAVDRKTGSRRQMRSSQHLDFFPSGRAVTVGSTTYVGRLAPMGVQAVNLANGASGWEYATHSPVKDLVSNGDGALSQTIGITEDGLLFALPPRPAVETVWAPTENWYRRLPGTQVVTPLALFGPSLCFGSQNGFLFHVDSRTGQIRWKVPCGTDMRGREATIAGNAIFQHSSGSLYAFSADTGKQLWTVEMGQRLITRIGDLCYVDMGAGKVSVRRAANGTEVASFETTGLVHVPTIQGGGQFIASDGDNVFVLN
jgi:outer membrane protein assembly factor BamB